MQRRERHLGGADQVQVVVGQRVDLLLGVGQHAGAVQRLLADEHRRDHRLEPLAAQLLERVADERELEHHQVPAQVGEARARTAARRAPCRSAGPASSRWSRPVWRRPRRTSRRTVSSSGASSAGRFGSEREHRVELGPQRGLLDRSARGRGRRARRAARALAASEAPRRPRLAGSARRAAPRARFVSARQRSSSSSTRSTAAAASGPRRASAARTASGSLADQPDVENGPRLRVLRCRRLVRSSHHCWHCSTTCPRLRPRAAVAVAGGGGADRLRAALRHARRLRRLAPGVLGDELGDVDRVLADDDVLGHDRAGEAAVLRSRRGRASTGRSQRCRSSGRW